MIKLLKYEFLRSYKVIMTACSIIILFNIALLFKSPSWIFGKLSMFLPAIILLTLSITVFYEIGVFKKDFIDNFPSIVQFIPRPAYQFFGAKILKSFICLSVYYMILVLFSFINTKDYLNSILIFYKSYQSIPMMAVVYLNIILLILNLLLSGYLSLLVASRISFDRKKIFMLASVSGFIIISFIVFMVISIEFPFTYSVNIYQCGISLVIFSILFISCCIMFENKPFLSFRNSIQLLIPVICIVLLINAGQYIAYTQRIVENADYTFTDDPSVKGSWKYLMMTEDTAVFDPNNLPKTVTYPGLELIDIMDGGNSNIDYIKWTKNMLINTKYPTVNNYSIKNIYGDNYLFIEWKDRDYVYEHTKPVYLIYRQIKK